MEIRQQINQWLFQFRRLTKQKHSDLLSGLTPVAIRHRVVHQDQLVGRMLSLNALSDKNHDLISIHRCVSFHAEWLHHDNVRCQVVKVVIHNLIVSGLTVTGLLLGLGARIIRLSYAAIF